MPTLSYGAVHIQGIRLDLKKIQDFLQKNGLMDDPGQNSESEQFCAFEQKRLIGASVFHFGVELLAVPDFEILEHSRNHYFFFQAPVFAKAAGDKDAPLPGQERIPWRGR